MKTRIFSFFMFFAVDLGGSTIDIVSFSGKNNRFSFCASLESSEVDKTDIDGIFRAANISYASAEKIVLTGGHSRLFSKAIGVPVHIVSEIDAIGEGGTFLSQRDSALVCSLGTGTCLVSSKNHIHTHIGGTGVGGGTLVGLCSALVRVSDFSDIQLLASRGDARHTDLSVKDIVGSGIGIVPPTATASNLAKLSSHTSPHDTVCGVATMIGQTIASLAAFAAQAHGHQTIVLGGKLTRLPQVVRILQETGALYKKTIFLPKHAAYMSAIGAGVLSCR